jgi:hypothetical protein
MTNHRICDLRSSWVIDLRAGTARHIDGWVFKFLPVSGEPGAFSGVLVRQPASMTPELMSQAPHLAYEAGQIYAEASAALTKFVSELFRL